MLQNARSRLKRLALLVSHQKRVANPENAKCSFKQTPL
jgi:hypothetical protein